MKTTSNRPHSLGADQVTADLRVVKCDRFSHRQAIHILHQHPQVVTNGRCGQLHFQMMHPTHINAVSALLIRLFLSQVSTSCWTGTSMTRIKRSQPTLIVMIIVELLVKAFKARPFVLLALLVLISLKSQDAPLELRTVI